MVHRARQPSHAHVLQPGMYGPSGPTQDEEESYCGAGNHTPAHVCTEQSFVTLSGLFCARAVTALGLTMLLPPDTSCPDIHFCSALGPDVCTQTHDLLQVQRKNSQICFAQVTIYYSHALVQVTIYYSHAVVCFYVTAFQGQS